VHCRRTQVRFTNLILGIPSMIDAYRLACISERGINGISPFCTPSNQ